MKINIGEILTRAWQILWKYKVLWIFGILAGCAGNGSSGNNFQYSFSSGDVGSLPPGVEDSLYRLSQQPGLMAGIVALFFLACCLFIIVVLALGAFGRIGLIAGTQKGDLGAERVTFGELFQSGKPFFWRVFGLQVFFGLALFLVIFIFMAIFAGFAVVTLGFGALCLMPLLCIFIPLLWLAAILVEQASIAIVVENRSIPDGLSRAWQVLSSDWGGMIVMALILTIGAFVLGVLIVLPFIVTTFPAMFAFLAQGQGARYTLLSVALLCACLYLPVVIFLNGIIQTYYHSAWTLTFLRLTGRGPALPEPAKAPTSPAPPAPPTPA